MPVKRNVKKSTKQKKLIQTIGTIQDVSSGGLNKNSAKEEAIIRQFHQIQKGYSRLMNDVAKELDLVRVWIGTQAMVKGQAFKTKLNAKLTRN